MSITEAIGLRILRMFPPETAHGLSIRALNLGLGPRQGPVRTSRLQTNIAGLKLPNPIGLAAGFDKNALAVEPLSQSGFGFIEVGGTTPLPQEGNVRPRLFRLSQDRAAINRFGLNNDGMSVIADRLDATSPHIPVGLNIGANKDSENRADDFARVLRRCGPYIAFASINVSSPNTERLRDLQGRDALAGLLEGVMEVREVLARRIPIFLKIAPDLSLDELIDITETAIDTQIDGIIATNTTLARDGLNSPSRDEKGGLSGQPLFESSTRVLAQISDLTQGAIPLIGVGGVASGAQAYAKILAGASAIQMYTGLVYGGLSLVRKIAWELEELLERDGFATVADAVGTGRDQWLDK